MKSLCIGTLVVTLGVVGSLAQIRAPQTVDGLVSAAKVAAGTDWTWTFARLCIPPPPAAPGAGGGRGQRSAGEANPFDVGSAAVSRYFTVVQNWRRPQRSGQPSPATNCGYTSARSVDHPPAMELTASRASSRTCISPLSAL
jgi:hypothetical protein